MKRQVTATEQRFIGVIAYKRSFKSAQYTRGSATGFQPIRVTWYLRGVVGGSFAWNVGFSTVIGLGSHRFISDSGIGVLVERGGSFGRGVTSKWVR